MRVIARSRMLVPGIVGSILVLSACGGLGAQDAPRAPAPSGDPESGRAAAATVSCPGGGEPSYYSGEVSEGDSPGGPATPTEALGVLWERENVQLDASSFNVAARNSKAAQLVYVHDGSRVFSAFAEKQGDSWIITEFFACTAWLNDALAHES
jgi:hypothetical protein